MIILSVGDYAEKWELTHTGTGVQMALSLWKTLLSSTTVQDMILYNPAILLFNIFISLKAL